MKNKFFLFFFGASFRLMLNYKIGYYFDRKGGKFAHLIISYLRYKQITKRNCQISYKSKIGKNIEFAHPLGIVIGDFVVIGDNVKIWQQVTLGSHGKREFPLEYPIIKNNVKIFAGAKVFGNIIIGENSVVGANAVVNIDVPANSVAVGIPCRIIKK